MTLGLLSKLRLQLHPYSDAEPRTQAKREETDSGNSTFSKTLVLPVLQVHAASAWGLCVLLAVGEGGAGVMECSRDVCLNSFKATKA